MKPSPLRYAGDGRELEVSLLTAFSSDEESLTIQDGRDDADINTIVKRFGIGFEMPSARSVGEFGDFSGVTDYQTALNEVLAADEAFAELPPHLRSRFRNDPGMMWDFVHDPKNREEAIELGLVVKPAPAPEPQRVVVVPTEDPAK